MKFRTLAVLTSLVAVSLGGGVVACDGGDAGTPDAPAIDGSDAGGGHQNDADIDWASEGGALRADGATAGGDAATAVGDAATAVGDATSKPADASSIKDAGAVVDASPIVCGAGQYAIDVVDYFSGARLSGVTIKVDGAVASGPCLTLAAGVHPLVVGVHGYPTYNNAVQVPGGAMHRTVRLFPVTSSTWSWLTLVNSDRAANGAGPLQLDNALTTVAWNHAVDMGVKRYFAHFDPHGYAPTTRSLMQGSMMISAENLGAGGQSFGQIEQLFMAERSSLPNKAPGDCATHYELAGHYCDLIRASHNWVGLAAVNVPGSPWVTYFDQEFGDLYGYYDTTVLAPGAAVGTSKPLILIPAPGLAFTYEFVQTMPAPTPIALATLNADPTCASTCPAGDPWYPSGNIAVSTTGPVAYVPPLSASQIVFVELNTNASSFFGASVEAAFWGSGTPMPDTYGASAQSYLIP